MNIKDRIFEVLRENTAEVKIRAQSKQIKLKWINKKKVKTDK